MLRRCLVRAEDSEARKPTAQPREPTRSGSVRSLVTRRVGSDQTALHLLAASSGKISAAQILGSCDPRGRSV